MVAIDVDVQYSLVCLEELQDAQNTVIDVAEARGLELFGVVETACPVDCNVSIALRDLIRSHQCSSCVPLAVVIHEIEDRTVVIRLDQEPLEVVIVLLLVLD